MKSFNEHLFENCAELTTIQFPPLLEVIGQYCFQGCRFLKTSVLPPVLKSIQTNTFQGCTSLETVVYCGTETINSENPFMNLPVTKILVTPNYLSQTFCSIPVSKSLDNNCLLPKAAPITCDGKINLRRQISIFVFVLFLQL